MAGRDGVNLPHKYHYLLWAGMHDKIELTQSCLCGMYCQSLLVLSKFAGTVPATQTASILAFLVGYP